MKSRRVYANKKDIQDRLEYLEEYGKQISKELDELDIINDYISKDKTNNIKDIYLQTATIGINDKNKGYNKKVKDVSNEIIINDDNDDNDININTKKILDIEYKGYELGCYISDLNSYNKAQLINILVIILEFKNKFNTLFNKIFNIFRFGNIFNAKFVKKNYKDIYTYWSKEEIIEYIKYFYFNIKNDDNNDEIYKLSAPVILKGKYIKII